MSQEVERVYTINLGKVWLSPNNQRAKRAINMIREFATHHMKTEQIKIDP
ncbi:MAG TPA: 50S ribosomal protein L31, partial [Candidatus Nitrosotenuis sp.]